MMCMARTERIELRVSPADKRSIVSAAAMEHSTTTEFVRSAVLDRARHVGARAERTLMPAEQFDALVASLDVPEDIPALTQAFARSRTFTQQ